MPACVRSSATLFCAFVYIVDLLQKVTKSKIGKWGSGLSCRSAAAGLLGMRVRVPLGAWVYVSCVCWVLCR
jgi:hypothetical protein